MTDRYNPLAVPIKEAATIILVAQRPDIHILIMQRNINTVFGGGKWVFPGGGLDAQDRSDAMKTLSTHLSDQYASQILQLPEGGLGYYVAAIREAFEEAGILLALTQEHQQPLDLSDSLIESRFMAHRAQLNNQNLTFTEILHQEKLILDTTPMHYVARWITPCGPPRRFDARFFVAQVPVGQEAAHDDNELVHSKWMSPGEILEHHSKGEMGLMEPTLRLIKNLCLFNSTDELMASAAATDMPYHRVRYHSKHNILVPGEPGYEDAAENIESGWVRLRPLGEQA